MTDRQVPREARLLSMMQSQCSRQELCRNDIRRRLEKRGAEPAVIERIIGQLCEDRFLDEERYAGAYIRDKIRFQGWGPAKVSGMLRIKGIPDDVIQEALSVTDQTLFEENLKDALLRKNKTIKEADSRKRYAKLVRFGLGKGYGYLQIARCLTLLKIFMPE
ncbi:MAG: regulatory protein RecX [Bacteroidales bacterium]